LIIMTDTSSKQMPGFGTYRLVGEDARKATCYALKQGYGQIDTAPRYDNLEHVGRGISESGRSRSSFRITTKISHDALNDPDEGSVKRMFFETIKKLGVDYVDEVILHDPTEAVRNWGRLVSLYQNEGRGLIGRIGVSNFGIDDIVKIVDASGVTPSVNQIEINPFFTQRKLVEACKEKGIEIVGHSPLAKAELMDEQKLLGVAKQMTEKAGTVVTPAQVMLSWGIKMGHRVIPRSKNTDHIDENLKVQANAGSEVFELDDDMMRIMSTLDYGYVTHPQYLKPGTPRVTKKDILKMRRMNGEL
ncbi:aldo/keto reductase, partial [Yasminevirus sp. GU-2018]